MAIRVQETASIRLDEIYRYTRDRWGEAQAETYITGLFAAFEQIDTRGVMSRPVPAEFGVEGYFFRYERHFVYWRRLSNGDIGIVTILHERMHQIDRFKEDFGSPQRKIYERGTDPDCCRESGIVPVQVPETCIVRRDALQV